MDDAWLRGMLDTAARTDTPYNDNPEHEEVIRALAAHEGSLEFMLNILTEPEKDWWPSAVQVIAAIGYPRNKSAIPMLVVHATDPNSPASFDALPALEKLPRSDLIAELASLFWAAQERQQDWEYRVEAACILTTHWGGVVAESLTPTIMFLLSQPTLCRPRWMSQALKVLDKVTPSHLEHAAPILISLARGNEDAAIASRAKQMLSQIQSETMKTYSLIWRE